MHTQHQQPAQFTPFTPAVRTPTNPNPGSYGSGLTVRGDDQPFGGQGQKSSRICRHYQRGRCTWGEHCRFLHEGMILPKEDRPFMGGGGGYHADYIPNQNGGGYGGGPNGSPNDASSRNLMLGLNQSRLQAMRHAKLITALKGTYEIQPTETPGQVQIISGAGLEPDNCTFLNEREVAQALTKLDEDERFKDGGLLMYVVGEPSVFYSAVRLYLAHGTCGHARLDFALHMAQTYGLVECMFYRSAAGCQAPKCGYEHRSLMNASQHSLSTPVSNSPTGPGMPSFTAQHQRYPASNGSSRNMFQCDSGTPDSESAFLRDPATKPRLGAPIGANSIDNQWEAIEKVVNTLKSASGDDLSGGSESDWKSSTTGGFLGLGSVTTQENEGPKSIW